MNILFVCAKNVARSQMAAAFYNRDAPAGSHADSAGTEVEEEGQTIGKRAEIVAPAARVLRVMNEKQIDLSGHKRVNVTEAMLAGYDKIIVMSEPARTPDFLARNPKAERWDIEDPRDKDLEGTRQTRDLIEQKVAALLA